jgi:hypothetical protein
MDVAKYIGLFLLKNNFVYIHGLGNLELKKKPASYTGQVLQAPEYEVVMTQTGSIDDNLANFIATNEQISISKASNALRDFSIKARNEMQAGGEVVIPSIGKFTEDRGKIAFVTDPHFQHLPPSIPSVRVAKRHDDTSYTTNADIPAVKPRYIDPDTEEEETSISWVKIAAWAAGLIVLSALIYFLVKYLNGPDNTNEPALIETPVEDTVTQAIPATDDGMVDSTGATMPDQNGLISFDVVLHTYTDLSKATARVSKLKTFGNDVQLVSEEDSSLHYVLMPVKNVSPADTAKLLDSLGRVFNPTRGVRVFQ